MKVSTIEEEEAMGRDADISSRIHTAQLSSDDIDEREQEISEIASKYRGNFKSQEDAVYFAMLPLNSEERDVLLDRVRANKKL